MQSGTVTTTSSRLNDDCPICSNSLAPGTPLLTLPCSHEFHIQCLAYSIKARNNQCSLCQTTIDASVIQLFTTAANTRTERRKRRLTSVLSSHERVVHRAPLVHFQQRNTRQDPIAHEFDITKERPYASSLSFARESSRIDRHSLTTRYSTSDFQIRIGQYRQEVECAASVILW